MAPREVTVESAGGTSTLTTGLVLELVAASAGPDGVDRVLARAGLAEQRGHLVSTTGRVGYRTKLALFEAAAEVLGDPRFGLRLGELAMVSSSLRGIRCLARSAGSPERVLRHVSRLSTRFDTATVFRCVTAGRDGATLGWRVLAPDGAHRVDCDYNIGALRQVPVLFGEAPATVRHPTCQMDGAAECRYEVTWSPPARLGAIRAGWRRLRRAEGTGAGVDAVRYEAELAALRAAAADVIGGGPLEDVLDRVAARADAALHAPGHVLVVTLPGGEQHVHVRGVGSAVQAAVGPLLALPPGLHDVAGHPVVTARVASAARHYGVLVAVALPGQEFYPEDAETLAAYAQHAAASLEISSHLARAGDEARTAQQLLEIAQSLSRHRTVDAVAASVAAAVPSLTGADRSAFALLEPGTGEVTIAGMSGWPAHLAAGVVDYATRPQESPELRALLESPSPVLLDHTGSAWARAMLADFEVEAMAAAPVVLDDRVLGLVLAHWVTAAPRRLAPALSERLVGLAGLAGIALDNARLLEQVRRQALHDPLTGLPNRLLVEDRLDEALAEARRDEGTVALLFCDVNRFKRVNDSLGHGAGDQLLCHVGAALQAAVRDDDTVARYSGDEFVLLLPRLASEGDLHDVVARIRARLAEPMTVAGEQVVVNLAVGSALSDGWSPGDPGRPENAAAFVARADLDMYQRKARTRGLPAPTAVDVDRLRLEADLRGAAGRGELVVHYQPQVDVATGATVAVEALVRWQHPELGLVPPSVFIPVAEDSGAIDEIGAYVLGEACRTVAGWSAGGRPLELAVNVSAAQLHAPGFSDVVLESLCRSGLAPERLVLEVTESQVVADASSDAHLRALRDLGIGISVDDFGTGYSSLTQLRRLPATEVKIDRTFTAELPASGPFVAGIVALAHGLGLRVVAEGVEHPQQLWALRAAGCDRAQGFLLGRPTVPEDVAERCDVLGTAVTPAVLAAAGR